MGVRKAMKVTTPVAIAVLLASCGGGTSDEGITTGASLVPAAGAANGPNNPSEENTNPGNDTMVTGRVADGYLQGATVCVDLNNSDSCDQNEPSALTGAGGVYDLNIPAGSEDKPIVAEIPAEAIDEDTGEAIGKPLVFVAPADQPQFISPITTLVHQELQSNPSLNIEEAENAVKTLLGVNVQDVSLFADYVAGGREGSGDVASEGEFKYLHDTARVVTSMMKDIESEVESAAQTNGIDVAGSEENQRAIRDIVRRQVRQLLPAIAQQVAVIVGGELSATSDQDTEADVDAEFNPETIALALRPDDISKDVQERIEAVVERAEPEQADIRQLLTEGVYWIELDCYHQEYVSLSIDNETQDGQPTQSKPSMDNITLDDDVNDGENGQFQSGEKRICEPYYGMVQLSATGNELVSQEYELDLRSGTWVEAVEDGYEGSEFILVSGQWQEMTFADSGPQGKVEFSDDGSAIITNAGGTLRVKAVTQSLDATTVRKHFLSDDADPAWFDLVRADDIFPSGSLLHGMSVKQTGSPYALFNEKPYPGSVDPSCAEYSDNCNVIGTSSRDEFVALRSLNEVREGALQDMAVKSLHFGMGPGATMTFMVDGENDGTFPTSGSVAWSYGYDVPDYSPYGLEGFDIDSLATYPAGQVDIDGCYFPDIFEGDIVPGVADDSDLSEGEFEIPFSEGGDIFPEVGDDQRLEEQAPNNIDELLPPHLPLTTPIQKCVDPAVQTGDYLTPVDGDVDPAGRPVVNETPVLTRWRIVEVEGVELIEIQLPDRYRFDGDSDGALLMAEHNGFVRLGERRTVSFVDRVATYNETAFATLRAIVESGDYTE
ncbi:MAG: hypothetical protein AB8B64_00290 [Granulosicoccus sp.]